MKKLTSAMAIITTCFSAGTLANNFNYNFLEFRTAVNPETFGFEFSTYMTDNTHAVLRADSQFEDDHDFAGGVGFNGPVNEFTDVYGQLLIHHVKYNQKAGGETETQVEGNIGMRVWIAERVEFTGRLGRNEDASVFHAGLRFHSTEQLTLSAETRNNGLYGPQITMTARFQY